MSQLAKDKIIKARVALQKTHPFFSYVALHLTMIETEEIPTMGVDNRGNCYFNSKFVEGMSQEEVKGVVCHEIMHVVLDHLKNLKGRQPQVANIAQDLCINDIVSNNGLSLPKEGLIPSNHSYTIPGLNKTIKDINKKVWEMIYEELEKMLPKKPQGMDGFDIHIRLGKDGGDGKGDDKDGEGKSIKGCAGSPDKNGEDLPWKAIVNEAYAYAKMQGKSPSGVDRLIDELNYPKLNWRELLCKFIIKEIPYDFNYMRPSRKSASTGVYLPSVHRENMEIAVGIDTSGSISPDDLRDSLSEVLGVIRAYDNVKLTVLSCDAEVHTIGVVENEMDIANLNLKGGGGTDFRPVFTWLEENAPMTKLLIFFTDGYGDFPEDTRIKTLWCISKGGLELDKIPFGERVQLDK